MTFRWSCFISYRLGKRKFAKDIIEDFHAVLSNELDTQVEEEVYLSQSELAAGDFLDPAVAAALCHSPCMVILFTGKYFSKTHPYCTREYLGMKRLEAERLGELGTSVSKEHGLIIPVMLRDADQLPAELKRRFTCDFQEFQQAEAGIVRPKRYFEEVRKLAQYIANRRRDLSELAAESSACEEFVLPDDDQARNFLSGLSSGTKGLV